MWPPKFKSLLCQGYRVYHGDSHFSCLIWFQMNYQNLLKIVGLNVSGLHVARHLSFLHRRVPWIAEDKVFRAIREVRDDSQHAVFLH